MNLQIHTLYLAATILLWIAVYYAAYWLVALARDPALVCMSVGPLGVSVISLREPPRGRLLAQLTCAAVAVAGAAYVSLFLVVPPPIGGLDRSLSARLVAVCIPVLAISATRLLSILRDRRYPLWGEARMLTATAETFTLYQIPSGAVMRYSNGNVELRGKGMDWTLTELGVAATLESCKQYAVPKP